VIQNKQSRGSYSIIRNDLLFVEWDVKPYQLTDFLSQVCTTTVV